VHYGYSLSLLFSKSSGNIGLDKIEVDVSKMLQYFEDCLEDNYFKYLKEKNFISF
jgi:hypothetical protein